jgi:hypothetical protein
MKHASTAASLKNNTPYPTTTRHLTAWFEFHVVCKFIHNLSAHLNRIMLLKIPVHLKPLGC